ncbi:DUF1707 SHOCT-like domain-containing protein [Pseudonocardia humida]|uniref:DUF1707 domain-containing protein n=1 Tax=Pseudonocardia humida TaxID=2800819 RepID=A0ABT1ABE9_9PSEU|nr:DUF1707 domain-containing protein [Pseudonocardia humida]MCO1660328.1 DUF1707 domain-containing protein [Pseudonocardia humida]
MSSTPDAMRVSDDDRDRVAALLREAVGRGQLDLAEADDRLRAVYSAVTRADLVAVTRDLPQAAAVPPAPRSAPSRPATRSSAEWRSWLGVSLLLLGIWAATSLAAGHALFFWPVFPIAFWGLALASGAKGHGCRTLSSHRS